MDKTNTNNDDSVLVETIETEITNRIGANINKRINNIRWSKLVNDRVVWQLIHTLL